MGAGPSYFELPIVQSTVAVHYAATPCLVLLRFGRAALLLTVRVGKVCTKGEALLHAANLKLAVQDLSSRSTAACFSNQNACGSPTATQMLITARTCRETVIIAVQASFMRLLHSFSITL